MLGWFQALMPKEERFFDLFARHSEAVVGGATALRAMLEGGNAVKTNYETVMLLRDVGNLRDFFGRFAPELLVTQFGAEIWALYTRGVLQPATPLTGRFEERQGPVDVAGVLRVVDDARDEEAARLLRMRSAG